MWKYFWGNLWSSVKMIGLLALICLSIFGVLFLINTAYAGFICATLGVAVVFVMVVCSILNARERYRVELCERQKYAKKDLEREFENLYRLIENVRKPNDEVEYRVKQFKNMCELYLNDWGAEDGTYYIWKLRLEELLEYYKMGELLNECQ